MKRTIKAITVAVPVILQVGQSTINTAFRYELGAELNGHFISEIKDTSAEWENKIDFMYDIKNSVGETIVRLENCPTIVEFEVDAVSEETVDIVDITTDDLPF